MYTSTPTPQLESSEDLISTLSLILNAFANIWHPMETTA